MTRSELAPVVQAPKPTPCAKWTDDCQGKKDYDGRLISISCRYWPRGGGFHIYNSATGEFKKSENPEIKPSASASIHLNFNEPDDYGYGDYRELAQQNFEADTEAEVKTLVEAWVAEKFAKVIALLEGKL